MRLLTAVMKALLCVGIAIVGTLLIVEWVSFSTKHGWAIGVCIAPFAILGFAVIAAGFYNTEKRP